MHIANAKQGPEIPNNLSKEAQDFLNRCLQVEPKKRWNVYKLLKHPFIMSQPPQSPAYLEKYSALT